VKWLPTLATCPSSANWLPSGQHQYAGKPAFQARFQAEVAPELHFGGTVAPVSAAQDMWTGITEEKGRGFPRPKIDQSFCDACEAESPVLIRIGSSQDRQKACRCFSP
jgi:hypothetical protein